MTTLTIESLRENPWNVITQPLPELPAQLLLEVAYRAAEYCAASEYQLMQEARGGRYTPQWFTSDEICPDAHEESEERGLRAEAKLEEIDAIYQRMYGTLR